MLSLIEILIILSGISAAQAGPMRRYTNTTSQVSDTLSTGVGYSPAAGVPALSLAPVQGITTLPLSLLAEAATQSPTVSDPANEVLPTTTATSVQSFKYQPLESGDSAAQDSAPTSFSFVGSDNSESTVTLTSTSFVYVTAQSGQTADPQSSQQNAPPNPSGNATTTTCEESMSQTSAVVTHEPIPTTSSTTAIEPTSALPGSTNEIPSSSPTQASESSATTSSTTDLTPPEATEATTSRFAYPYPTTTDAIAQNDEVNPPASSAPPRFSFHASDQDLPEVVIESTQTQDQKHYGASDSDNLVTTSTAPSLASPPPPGITIVPQNPSVIYITVTDAGVTTTVTA